MKTIHPKTNVYELTEAFPFLTEALAAAFPKFAPLKNPALRATLGRMATLQRAAEMADVPVADLLAKVADLVRQQGAEIAVAGAEPEGDRMAKVAALKGIIEKLHAGGSLEEARREFETVAGTATAGEIAEMEQALIRGGMPVESIQRLCDVHVNVFRGSLDKQETPPPPPGHPVHTYMAENRALEQVANRWTALCRTVESDSPPAADALAAALQELAGVETHYARKENQLFPALEKHGFTGPSKVMWAAHDDIRAKIKAVRGALAAGDLKQAAADGLELVRLMTEMIYKEEKILFPAALDKIAPEEWAAIRAGDDAIGYVFVQPGNEWTPAIPAAAPAAPPSAADGTIPLSTGALTPEQLERILVTLPVEISFVDDQDIVRFYSDHAHRIFPRSPGVIGRAVQNCHPPKSVHMVEAILKAFKEGRRDKAQFWLEMGGTFILIAYHAVRSQTGQYLGCLEVTQDVTGIRALQGQRRLLEWD